MNCSKVQANLSAYIDSELPGFDMLDIRSHLGTCAYCRAEEEAIRELKRFISSAPCCAPGCEFEQRLVESVMLRVNRRSAWTFGFGNRGVLAFAGAFVVIGFVVVMAQSGSAHSPHGRPSAANGQPLSLNETPATPAQQASDRLREDHAFYQSGDPLGGPAATLTASYGGR